MTTAHLIFIIVVYIIFGLLNSVVLVYLQISQEDAEMEGRYVLLAIRFLLWPLYFLRAFLFIL